jgi:hypothetical protein
MILEKKGWEDNQVEQISFSVQRAPLSKKSQIGEINQMLAIKK